MSGMQPRFDYSEAAPGVTAAMYAVERYLRKSPPQAQAAQHENT